MIPILRGTTIPALEQTLGFSERRHEVLAGNIANLDTPGYQARDLSVTGFQEALAQALHQASYAEASPSGETPTIEQLGDHVEKLLYHDGKVLNLERQVTEMAKNEHLHSLAVALMRSQFQILQTAISERV